MSGDLDKLEQIVEHEMHVLDSLDAPAPRSECLARVKAAIAAESARRARRRRVLRVAPIGLGVAAAAVLAIVWLSRTPAAPELGVSDPDVVVAEWTAALDETNSRLASVAENGWTHGDPATRDEDAELDGLLRGLDQSFEQLGAL